MKFLVQTILAGVLFIIIVPMVIALVLGNGGLKGTENPGVSFADKIQTPETIEVWLDKEGKKTEVDFEEYVARVVASEMPSEFEYEALKAQSVAARTYSMAKIEKYKEKKPTSHPKASICDTTHCQVYKTEEALIEAHKDGWEDNGWKKIKKACKATEGELLYYDGKLVMQPLFFSSSGGQTENSEDVFVGTYPYLVSVSSPYEEEASHRNEEKDFTIKGFKAALAEAYPKKQLGDVNQSNIKVLSRTSGGRVAQMQVGQAKFKGTEIRTALGLSSALFSISFEEGTGWKGDSPSNTKIIFTSNGYGHGVGMSQYGADGMAKEGHDYKEILKHYYSGSEVY